MVDKIGIVLKDFMIHIIPGLLICYLSVHIMGVESIVLPEIKSNSNIGIFILLVAFVIGFISTQVQLIIANLLKSNELWTLASMDIDIKVKNSVIEKVCQLLKIEEKSYKQDLLKDNKLVFFCFYHIKAKANNEAINIVERDSYLASFAISIYFPILLSFVYISNKLVSEWYLKSIGIIFCSTILFLLIKKIVITFERNWAEKVYYLFNSTVE